MTDSQPKFKFKKRSKAALKKKQLRRTDEATKNVDVNAEIIPSSTAEDGKGAPPSVDTIPHHSDDEEEPSALNAIMAVERRRKLLGTRNRGVDAASLGKNTKKDVVDAVASTMDDLAADVARNKDLEERLKGTFAGGKLAGSNDMGGDDEGGILAKKHRRAMEEFIQKNLGNQEGGGGEGSVSGSNNGSAKGEVKNNASEAEKELYAELLTTNADEGEADAAKGEGDVGAGGAMMGGTGIAEVALPIDERIKTLKETEKAAMEYERARKARFGGVGDDRETLFQDVGQTNNQPSGAEPFDSSSLAAMVPMNFASGPGKRKRQEVGVLAMEDTTLQKATKLSQHNPTIQTEYPVESSAIPPGFHSASSAGPSVHRSDVSDLGASYSHNFQLHTKEWVSRKKDERQTEIDAMQAQHEAEEGPTTEESRARVGFEMARKIAKGEVVVPPSVSTGAANAGSGGHGRGPKGESLRNEWDRSGGHQQSSDDRVWKTFMSKQRNRR